MRRICVIGCPGSGKSRFARMLHDITGIPLHHIDMIYWNPDGTPVEKNLFKRILAEVVSTESWIIDGNNTSTLEDRVVACDTVFYLDFEKESCLQGLEERRGKPRPDLPWEDKGDNAEFLEYVETFNEVRRPFLMELLGRHPEKKIVILRDRNEVDDYLDGLKR